MIPWLLMAVVIALILLGILSFYLYRGKKHKTDYYALFTMGIIWTAIGIPLKNYALSVMGIIFLIVGLVNKKKWKENRRTWKDLDSKEKKIKLIVIIALGVLVFFGLVAYFIVQKGS